MPSHNNFMQLLPELRRKSPLLLNDEQVREYIANGYVLLRPSVPDELHDLIREKFDSITEHEHNPGNNILPRLPELELILQCPVVRGAVISVLGENYVRHPHRFWHYIGPRSEPPPEEILKKVAGGCHQDAYTPSGQPKSHYSRYARIMYYAQDTQIELGPTHVIPGSQYHASLTEEDRQRIIPVTGEAGQLFLSHFDIGHSGGVNLFEDRARHMIKFIYFRADEPTMPSWKCEGADWRTPANLTAPYNLEPAWKNIWDWMTGQRGSPNQTKEKSDEFSALIEALHEDVESALESLTSLADIGPAASEAVTSIVDLLNEAHQAVRTCAIYTLAAMGETAIPSLIKILQAAGERESENPESAAWNDHSLSLDDAAYSLAAIGEAAVEPVLPLLDSEHEWTRINAAFALGEMEHGARPALHALEKLLHDPSYRVIRMALNALGCIKGNVPLARISELLMEDQDGWDEVLAFTFTARNTVNTTAAITMARLGIEASPAEAALIDTLLNPLEQASILAAETLERIGTSTAKEAVWEDMKFRRWDASLSKSRPF